MWTIHIEAIALLLSKYPPIDGVRESQPTAVYGEVPPAKLPLPRYHFIYSYMRDSFCVSSMLETLPHVVGHTERANAYLAEEMGSRVRQDRALQSCGARKNTQTSL